MNFYSKYKSKRYILLFILMILMSEIFLITKIYSVKKSELKNINEEIKNTEEGISKLKPNVKVKSSLNKDYLNLKNDSVIGKIESPVFNDDDESLSFKVNSMYFNDLIHISNNYNYKMLLLNKIADDKYNAEVIFTKRNVIVNQNENKNKEKDISSFMEKIKNTYVSNNKNSNNKKFSNQNNKSNNKLNNKTDLKDNSSLLDSNINSKKIINKIKENSEVGNSPLIKYSEKINLEEKDLKLLLSENNFGEIIYNTEKDIFEIYFKKYSASKYPNIIRFSSNYNIKALSFEIFYSDNSVEEIGLLGDELYKNTLEKEIGAWNKLNFYDAENIEGIYFIINSSLTNGFCIKNIEVYI